MNKVDVSMAFRQTSSVTDAEFERLFENCYSVANTYYTRTLSLMTLMFK